MNFFLDSINFFKTPLHISEINPKLLGVLLI